MDNISISLEETLRYIEERKRHGMPSQWPEDVKISRLMEIYKERMGYAFDIFKPELFTEKIQWYKLFYDHPDLANIVDKYTFKKYVADKLGDGYTIDCYGVWDDINQMEEAWDSLPESIVLKSTNSTESRNCIILKEKITHFNKLKPLLQTWFDPYNTAASSYCRAYQNAKPRILAEKYEVGVNGELLDYKVFCFQGKPYCFLAIETVKRRTSKAEYSLIMDGFGKSFYDLQWNNLGVTLGNAVTWDAPEPWHKDEMIELAKKLSAPFPYVRVDFFDTEDRLFIGEMTFYPNGGIKPIRPDSFNKTLGELFVLPQVKSE